MGTEGRGNTASLRDQLFERPGRFEFFQAVRLLKKLRPEGRVGAEDPDDEIVRFCSDVSLAFPAADVTELRPPGEEERAARMKVAFLGVATPGSFGALPLCYTAEVRSQDAEKNTALHDFLDLFNHRMTGLYYRAWEKYRIDVEHESGEHRYFERALFALIGLGTEGLRGRVSFDDRALLARAGLVSRRPAPASVIASLVESYLEVPARVRQFVPAWYDIDPEDQTRLGSANSRLGQDVVAGASIRLVQSKFEVGVGPLDWQRYQDFFPSAAGFRALVDLVRVSVTPEIDFQCRLVLRAEEVPALRLERTPSQACRLGWSTWLLADERTRDADDAVLAAESLPPPTPFGAAGALTSMEARS